MKNKFHQINILNKRLLIHENLSMKIYNSLELDISKDGKSILNDDELAFNDFYISSIHDQFTLTSDENTSRIIKSLESPKALILGHPTSRTLRWRQSINANWDQIFNYCKKNDKYLEINAWPDRLDLPVNLILKAKSIGCKFIIGSDAHQSNHLSMIKYGIYQARRAGITSDEVLNTLEIPELNKLVSKLSA